MKLLHADTLEQVREKLLAADILSPRKETVPIADACGRILAETITAPISVPDFAKSTVDGYAVLAKDTQGAGENIPCFLDIIGEVSIGDPAEQKIAPGQCVYVPTGGMLPEGADAMVMVEHAERFDEKSCAVSAAVSPGTRVLFDYKLKQLDISRDQIDGYDREAATHMAVAAAVAGDGCDAGMGILSAAKAMDLDFIPVADEEYDFAIPEKYIEDPRVRAFLEILESGEFRKRAEELGGYTFRRTGEVIRL